MNVFDLVAKIRLDSSEYEQGVGKAKGTFSSLASGVKTGLATVAKVGAAAVTAGVAGVTALTKMGVDGYKQYEQLAGGAELLWGGAYSFIADKAKGAYATVQMSQNDYLQQVNGFAVGLKTALGGNEQAAADLADRIITAEADIVAATGNTQENVQNAFNGIMKNNFSMVDNLGLGITATKEGFQTMIDSVNAYNTAHGNSTKYTIDNVADCQAALLDYIKMQGMSGYAGMEAAGTIEGSVSMMKAAWENLVVGMADSNADIGTLINNFVGSVDIAAHQIMPRIEQTLAGIGQLIEKMAPIIADALPKVVEALLPTIITSGITLITALANALVTALPAVKTALEEGFVTILTDVFGVSEEQARGFVDKLNEVWDKLVAAFDKVGEGFNKVSEFAGRLWDNCQPLVSLIRDNLMSAFDGLKEPLSSIKEHFNELAPILGSVLAGAVGTAIGLFNGIVSAVSGVATVVSGLVEIFTGTIQAIVGVFTGDGEMILAAADNIGDGIITVFGGLWDACEGFVSGFVDGVIGFFEGLWDTLVGHSIVPDTIDGIVNCFGELWGRVSGSVSDFCANVISFFSKLWESVKQATKNFLDNVKTVISSGLNNAKTTISNILTNIKSNFVNIWNNCKSTVSTAISDVKSAISSGMNGAKSTVSSVLDGIKTKFTTIWDNCKTIVKNAVTALKNALDFHWELPKLKLPHISVSGGVAPYGIGGKGSLPKFSIEWYKKAYDNAMILSNPTIFGYSNGKFLGGGDGNGNEIVAGESYLMNLIGNVVAERNGQIVELLAALLEATVDGNSEMLRELKAGHVIALNERELGRTVRGLA